jgi:hypothetical protein
MKRSLMISSLLLACCLSTPLYADGPCTECLQKTLAKLSSCLASAKTEADKSACDRQANKENASCQQIDMCKKPTR